MQHPRTPLQTHPIGQRQTRQRTAILDTLKGLDGFASAQGIYEILSANGHSVGLSTVYRNLQALAEVDAVDVLRTSSGESLYRQCTPGVHHHHLVCQDCGTTVEIDDGPIHDYVHEISAQHGFVTTGHTFEIFGMCGDCAARRS